MARTASAAAMRQTDRVWIRIPGQYNGKTLDRGQVVPKLGSAKDGRLLELAYIVSCEPDIETYQCPECGAEFTEDVWRRGHYERWHAPKAIPLPQRMDRESEGDYAERVAAWKEQQDEADARKREREMAQMPPDMDKTLASRR